MSNTKLFLSFYDENVVVSFVKVLTKIVQSKGKMHYVFR